MSEIEREELHKDWLDFLERKKKMSDHLVEMLETSVNHCLPESVEFAAKLASKTHDLRDVARITREFGEINDAEEEKIVQYSWMREENLNELMTRFKEKCGCKPL